jgi:REP element-mobilizing transposase RayT
MSSPTVSVSAFKQIVYLSLKIISPHYNYTGHRNSYTGLNEIYFWKITINNWNHLLKNDDNKMIVISSLQWLVQDELVEIYGYVIMPNHIHLLWQQLRINGKEFPKNSFEEFTAKSLVKKMKQQNDSELKKEVLASGRKYNTWLRDPLAVRIFSKEMAEEKLNYLHCNPLQTHWNLCKMPDEYRFHRRLFIRRGQMNLIW